MATELVGASVWEAKLYEHLTAHGVRLSIRRDLLRFSFHLYNNTDDVDEVVRLSEEWLRQQRARERASARQDA